MFLTIFLFCIAVVVYRWIMVRSNDPPPFPGMLPVLGHALKLIGNTEHLWNIIEENINSVNVSQLSTLWIGPRKLYVLMDPDDIQTIANNFYEKAYFYNFGKSWLGNGLITADAMLWKTHRKLLNPTFNPQILDGFINVLNDYGRRLVEDLAEKAGKGYFDHTPYIYCNALESISATTLGVDITEKALSDKYVNTLEHIFNLYVERFQQFWCHLDFIWNRSKNKVKEDEYIKILNSVTNTIIEARRNALRQNPDLEIKTGRPFKSFLDLLLEMEMEGNIFTHSDIRNHVDTLITGGHDTSATTLIYAMLLVGSYPHVQERLHAEFREVFGNSDRDVEKKDLIKLVYTEAVLKETMRMYSAVPLIARVLQRDVKLRNFTLKSGCSCLLILYGAHRHPVWGEDAYDFKPERWLDPTKLPKNPNFFMAFSVGKRACIGRTYAMQSMKIIFSHVMRHYNVTGDHKKMKLKMEVLLKPVSGHNIAIEKRSMTSN